MKKEFFFLNTMIYRFAAVFYNGEVYRIRIFANHAYLVFVDITGENELIRPRHVIGLGYSADVDNSLDIGSLELCYGAAVSLYGNANRIRTHAGYGEITLAQKFLLPLKLNRYPGKRQVSVSRVLTGHIHPHKK